MEESACDAISSEKPVLSIVIPNFNRRDLLLRCLETVHRHRPKNSEVIVVDDGSTDGSCSAIVESFPTTQVIALRRNGGFCRAANIGWRAARAPFVELLNNDTEVTPGWAEPALESFSDSNIGAVAPLVRKLPFRKYVDSAGDLCSPLGQARKRGEGAPWSQFQTPTDNVFSASASSAFFRRDALEQAGGFPEDFGAYLDDVDLGFRLRSRGYRCRFEPRSTVFHWVSQSHQVTHRHLLQQISRNAELLFWRNLDGLQAWKAAFVRLAYLLVWLSYKAIRGEFAPAFLGKCESLTRIPCNPKLSRLTSLWNKSLPEKMTPETNIAINPL